MRLVSGEPNSPHGIAQDGSDEKTMQKRKEASEK
jgi:hypothetical protein